MEVQDVPLYIHNTMLHIEIVYIILVGLLQFFPEGGITMYAGHLHAHTIGK